MRNTFLAMAILFCIACTPKVQQNISTTSIIYPVLKCSDALSKVSYYWALDSLANNGYRRVSYRRISNCTIDTTTAAYVLNKLGKPTRIDSFWSKDYAYVYYYYDYKHMDTTKTQPPYGYDMITFTFDSKSNRLQNVGVGTGEY